MHATERTPAGRPARRARRGCGCRTSACPMLLPDVDTVAPKVISAAPPAPMKTAAALTSGVEDEARSGSVPSATTCASVMIAGHDHDRHDQRERHRAPRVPRLRRPRPGRPRSRRTPKISSSPLAEIAAQASAADRSPAATDRSRTDPTTMKTSSGTSLPIRQHVDHDAALADAANVDGGNRDDDQRDHAGAAPSAVRAGQ